MRERVLVANRGESAIRICRGVRSAGYDPVVIHTPDYRGSLHTSAAEHRLALPETGPAAHFGIDRVVDAAVTMGCTYVHPGYGVLNEDAHFACVCEAAGLVSIGRSPSVLELVGDNAAVRDLAEKPGELDEFDCYA